ncbi:hypothetical protein JQC72_08755 [Polycladomyces sp. WAk]|uniref:Uncharacterized protein n=1 Tax=Polycladomyces zharkentensis TaxID=2807616 RepID=A0ABS2WJY9_9BACL|nr:hypothetical protein [Polycladomyces sp. WAk]MBN2909615.1 hypothetical protein [Polycladomyces sp. WAk]
MAKEEKAPKKTKATAQVKSEAEAALNENELDYPAYGYGAEGFYETPGYWDDPYPATSEYFSTGDGYYPYDYGTYDYGTATVPGDANADVSIFPFFRPFPFFGFPFFRPFPFFGFPFFRPFPFW